MVDTSTQNPLPVVGPSYNDQLLTFLAQEDADRFTDMLNPFVVENGLHGTSGGLTGNPGNTVAYPEGFYTTETSSILYPDNTANNWVILFKDIVTDPGGNWVQVAGTHYWIDSVSGSQPTEPTGSLILMRVTTSGGSITVVDDLRNLNAFTTAGDRVKISISDTTARFLAAALVQGSNITLTILNPGADETLQVVADDKKLTITTNDTTEGVLNDKLLVTAPLTKTTNDPGANETITLDIGLIETAKIADNAVTLAKVAHGTADRIFSTDNSGIPVLKQLVEAQIASDAVDWDTKIKAATAGDIVYFDASGNPQRLAKATDTQFLVLLSGIPGWRDLVASDISTGMIDNTHIATDAVRQVEIQAAAVGQGELKTTTGDMSTAIADNQLITGPGGEYGFWPTAKKSGGSNTNYTLTPLSPTDSNFTQSPTQNIGTSFLQRFNLSINDGTTLTARQRYVQASPPYELGGINILTFIFAMIEDGTGKILAMYQAADPPWANNGPTNIRPQRIDPKTGKGFRTIRTRKPLGNMNDPDFWTDTEIEITADYKNSDMGLIPHPFIGNDLTGKTIVMIDPRMKLIERLHEMIEAGESPLELFHNDDIRIGNTDIPAVIRPSGVLIVTGTLK